MLHTVLHNALLARLLLPIAEYNHLENLEVYQNIVFFIGAGAGVGVGVGVGLGGGNDVWGSPAPS